MVTGGLIVKKIELGRVYDKEGKATPYVVLGSKTDKRLRRRFWKQVHKKINGT
jgi:hypothetical protein